MDTSDPRPARETLAEDPPGARPDPPATAPGRPQEPRSPGQSEPGDMGAFEEETEAGTPHGGPAGDEGTGYRGG